MEKNKTKKHSRREDNLLYQTRHRLSSFLPWLQKVISRRRPTPPRCDLYRTSSQHSGRETGSSSKTAALTSPHFPLLTSAKWLMTPRKCFLGVSLLVSQLTTSRFSVALIAFWWQRSDGENSNLVGAKLPGQKSIDFSASGGHEQGEHTMKSLSHAALHVRPARRC